MDTWSFSQSFTPQFQAMRSELDTQITAAKSTSSPPPNVVQELSILLAKATKALADATGSIPSYDQKQYELQLKSFEKAIEDLRTSSAPKSKFVFKRKSQTSSSATPVTTAKVVDAPPSVSTSPSSNLVLSSHSHKYLTRASLPQHPQQTDLSIFDLNYCIVDLIPTPTDGTDQLVISALHARNLTHCVILLPLIEGSALLHDLSNCVIVVGCHQFRMHSSKKIDVLLSISSNPIIEDCNTIRFTQYPKMYLHAAAQEKEYTVQDFSHIRPTPSPHFSMMKEGDKGYIVNWLLRARQDSINVDALLSDVIPQ